MNKNLDVTVKLDVIAMEASSKEPIGPTLGQYGMPIDKFCDYFNKNTTIYNEKTPLRSKLFIYSDKNFDIIIKAPSINYTIKNSLIFENINLYNMKRKSGYFFENNEFLPSFNKNMIYTIVIFLLSLPSYDKIKEFSLFKKIKGTLSSTGILIFTE
jgi:ribosomal protein L11